jgi:hypothetical protein
MNNHYWFGREWSTSYFLAFNCKGKPLTPELVFEVGGDIDFVENKINEIWYLKMPIEMSEKPLNELVVFSKWECSEKLAKEIYERFYFPYTK